MNERQTAEWLMEREDFLILTHVRPDGDTIVQSLHIFLRLSLPDKLLFKFFAFRTLFASSSDYLVILFGPGIPRDYVLDFCHAHLSSLLSTPLPSVSTATYCRTAGGKASNSRSLFWRAV